MEGWERRSAVIAFLALCAKMQLRKERWRRGESARRRWRTREWPIPDRLQRVTLLTDGKARTTERRARVEGGEEERRSADRMCRWDTDRSIVGAANRRGKCREEEEEEEEVLSARSSPSARTPDAKHLASRSRCTLSSLSNIGLRSSRKSAARSRVQWCGEEASPPSPPPPLSPPLLPTSPLIEHLNFLQSEARCTRVQAEHARARLHLSGAESH